MMITLKPTHSKTARAARCASLKDVRILPSREESTRDMVPSRKCAVTRRAANAMWTDARPMHPKGHFAAYIGRRGPDARTRDARVKLSEKEYVKGTAQDHPPATMRDVPTK
mmetsp:Transcript_27745/g.59271  ORF Transcript_27745/g.59271 Transcript_27745/m.59271 type:complete len:111 (-) Transcript_27745:36-368(-)